MIPCLESAGGNCQNTVIPVEEMTVREKLLGGPDGTAIEYIVVSNELSEKEQKLASYKLTPICELLATYSELEHQ